MLLPYLIGARGTFIRLALAAVDCQGAGLIMRDFEGVCSKSHEAGWIPLLWKRARLFSEVGWIVGKGIYLV